MNAKRPQSKLSWVLGVRLPIPAPTVRALAPTELSPQAGGTSSCPGRTPVEQDQRIRKELPQDRPVGGHRKLRALPSEATQPPLDASLTTNVRDVWP